MMTKETLLKIFRIEDLRLLPEKIMSVLFSQERDMVFQELIQQNNYDVSYEWFQHIYEEEFSERSQKKQDFTPNTLGQLCSQICGNTDGATHEPTAGNGSMIIADWWRKCQQHLVWDFKPSRNKVDCWELSDRSIPILLLNLAIRGIAGTVHHGDVLTGEEKACYELINENDDCLCFSTIRKL